ncbi:unnamed protein product, partial [Nesidiocoris tenuis]
MEVLCVIYAPLVSFSFWPGGADAPLILPVVVLVKSTLNFCPNSSVFTACFTSQCVLTRKPRNLGSCRQVLTCKRVLQLRMHQLTHAEIINVLCKREPVY